MDIKLSWWVVFGKFGKWLLSLSLAVVWGLQALVALSNGSWLLALPYICLSAAYFLGDVLLLFVAAILGVTLPAELKGLTRKFIGNIRAKNFYVALFFMGLTGLWDCFAREPLLAIPLLVVGWGTLLVIIAADVRSYIRKKKIQRIIEESRHMDEEYEALLEESSMPDTNIQSKK